MYDYYDEVEMEVDNLAHMCLAGPSGPIDPLHFLNEARDWLRKACGRGGKWDALGDKANAGLTAYSKAAWILFGDGFNSAAEQLLFECWNDYGLRQIGEDQHIWRAPVAMTLAHWYIRTDDPGAALRWALLAYADEALGGHKTKSRQAKEALQTVLGMSDEALVGLDHIAAQNVESIGGETDQWSSVSGFAEDVIVRFALENPEFAHLFAQETSTCEFPLSKAYFRSLLDRVDIMDSSTQEKGNALEDLASYLFLLVPGWVPRRNLLDEKLAYESDIVVRNLNQISNLTAELLGRHFLVECKNWRQAVGVRDVGYFLYRMRLTHARFGVIFAKKGITGTESDEDAARSLIRKAFHEDGNICVVIGRDDLEILADATLTFWPMLLERVERVRFGQPRRAPD